MNNILLILKIIILGVIEAITEFLPISSTTHLLVADHFLQTGLTNDQFFLTIIQLGALFALLFYYQADIKNILYKTYHRKKEGFISFINLLNAFIISAILGLVIKNYIHNNYYLTFYALIILGIVMILITKKEEGNNQGKIDELFKINPLIALVIGAAQSLSAIAGVSRLGITLTTGLLFNFKKDIAIKFSFLLALPTMFAASCYELLKIIIHHEINFAHTSYYIIAFASSLLASLAFIKFLILFLTKCNIRFFGYYRLFLAIIIYGIFLR